jgi:aspartate aminotransferase
MEEKMISKRAQLLKPSPTLAMANRARELQAQGKDIVSLTVGEPDWATFPAACEAGIQAIREGFTKYTAAHGIVELRQEIAKQYSEMLKVPYNANEVVVGCGAKYILFAGMMMWLDPGDEVLIPTPYWVSYPAMVELAGAVPKFIECGEETRFKLTPDKLKASISNRTKILMLSSPSNPTGIQYSFDELKKLAEVIRANKNLHVISDDIYNRLLFSDEKMSPHLLHVAPDLRDRILVVNGVSKTYSMTGWRVGWALGAKELLAPMADFLSQTTSNVTSISQKAALVALQKCEGDLEKARQNLTKKKEMFQGLLDKISDFKVIPPDGAFYIWLDVKKTFGRKHKKSDSVIKNSKELCEILLNHHFVATVPGIEFGAEGYLRLSFVTSEANLKKAADRLREFTQELSAG